MTFTNTQNSFNINGFVDTGKNVIDNIEAIAASVGAWATYDIHLGKWAFILNEDTNPVYAFDDSNILGAINVSGTGLLELYNSVEVQFPHKDLGDVKDYRRVSIPSNQRFTNERDNKLIINMDTINDPVQAEMHALRELKQSRMDTVVEFQTDFNALGINAGDIFTLTSEQYGFSAKKFRVIRITETDDETGNIVLGITGLEWDPEIVNYGTITRFIRERATNITPIADNTDILGNEIQSSLKLTLTENAAAHGLALYYNSNDLSYLLDYGGEKVAFPDNALANGHIILNWTHDGLDLDIRCDVLSFQGTLDSQMDRLDKIGYGDPIQNTEWPRTSEGVYPTALIQWAGDNIGTGIESVLINVGAPLNDYNITSRYMVVRCFGNWYDTPGPSPVQLTGTLYNGGTFTINNLQWTASGFTSSRQISGVAGYVDSVNGFPVGDNLDIGQLIGYVVVDYLEGTVQIVNNLDRINLAEPLYP